MQIVIDVPDEELYKIEHDRVITDEQRAMLFCAITDGTPLPKGHGDLIDMNDLKGELWWVTDCPHIKLNEQALELWNGINAVKPIIPADNSEVD